jgi:hypothetical protein
MNSSEILHRECCPGWKTLLRIKAAAVRLVLGRAPSHL